MTFKEDTKKILEFFDNKELQEIFEKNFIHKKRINEVLDIMEYEIKPHILKKIKKMLEL